MSELFGFLEAPLVRQADGELKKSNVTNSTYRKFKIPFPRVSKLNPYIYYDLRILPLAFKFEFMRWTFKFTFHCVSVCMEEDVWKFRTKSSQRGECCTILDLHDPIALQAFLKAATSFDVAQNYQSYKY